MPAQYPGVGFPPSSEVSLLRRICNNTALMAESGGTPGGFVPAPAAPGSPGVAGNMAIDAEFLYVYSAAAGQWLRTPMNDWTP
jgi:hypothetical protein